MKLKFLMAYLLITNFIWGIDFTKITLKNPENIKSYKVLDINGDKLKDLIITYQKQSPEAHSLIGFFINSDSGFTRYFKLPIPGSEVIFDMEDILDFPGTELVTLSGKAIRIYRYTERGYRIADKISIDDPLLSLPTFRHILYYKFIHKLSEMDRGTLIIPEMNGFKIFESDGADIKISGYLNIPGTAIYSSSRRKKDENISIEINLPSFKILDINEDKEKDLVFYHNDAISVFIRKKSGFAQNPDYVAKLRLKDSEGNPVVLNKMDRERREWYNLSAITDANNDGILDLFILKGDTRQSTFDPTSQIQIYYGKKKNGGLVFNPTPDQIIVSEGMQFDVNLSDLNDDGFVDLAIPTMKMGLFKIISMLVTRSATIDINFYKNNGVFPKLPTAVRELDMSFEFSGNFTSPVFNYDGDFNGDGINDLLTSGSDEEIAIHYGGKEDFFSEEPDARFPMELPRNGHNVRVYDFNNDGYADIVYTYEKQDNPDKDMRNLMVLYIQRR